MRDIGRILSILLALQSKRAATARELAARFEVSTRTIYRDLETLSRLGVPVYAERGRNGGIRLLEGYFLPPLMFTRGEAVALLLGLTLLGGLRAAPFPAEQETAGQKLLAAVPTHLRATLARLERTLGVERPHADLLHPEEGAESAESEGGGEGDPAAESAVVTGFLQAALDGRMVRLHYQAPHRRAAREREARPLGAFWDRDRWYLVGRIGQTADALGETERDGERRIWRADRVVALAAGPASGPREGDRPGFDVRALLGHAWLHEAMEDWRGHAPVRLRITRAQAALLRQDWYYRHARYEPLADGSVALSFGEGDAAVVLALVRWLGPGAEVLEPAGWRELLRAELRDMQRQHGGRDTDGESEAADPTTRDR